MIAAAISALRAVWAVPGLRRIAAGLGLALVLFAGWTWLSGALRAQGARSAAASAARSVQRAEQEIASLRAELELARETARRAKEIANALAEFERNRDRLDRAGTAARRSLDEAAAELRAVAPPISPTSPPVGPDSVVDPVLAGALRGAVERLRDAAYGPGGLDSQISGTASASH